MIEEQEIAGQTRNKLKLAVASVLTLAAAAALMGSVDLGSTSPAMRGDWDVHVDAASTECNRSGHRRLDLRVNDEGIVVTKPGALEGEGLRAFVNGKDLRFEIRYTNAAGVETVESVELHLEDGVMTGTSAYTEIRDPETCSATATVVATR